VSSSTPIAESTTVDTRPLLAVTQASINID
jgi:hypothetical protein